MKPLGVLEAYRLWAPDYAAETAISWLEDQLVTGLTPSLAGLRLLDAGCGTGRRLAGTGAASAVGVDLCPEMLAAGADARGAPLMIGDLRSLPLTDREFDVVWCRLAIGHVADCAAVYAELARVADTGAQVIVSDFHPRAHETGHRRTFRHDGVVHEVEHYAHEISAHLAAAASAGLGDAQIREATIGPAIRGFYERAGKLAQYEEHRGLPIVLALGFTKGGAG